LSAIITTTRSSMPTRNAVRRRVVWLLLLALIVAFLTWGYVLMRLTSASREGVDAFENRVRHGLVHRGYLPRSYRHWYPDHQDLIKHFAFYAPFGLMAGVAAALVRLSPAGTFPRWVTPRRAAVMLLLLGISLCTIDEIRQIWIPTRSAEVSDALAGWCGIATAFVLWTMAERGVRLTIPRRFLARGPTSTDHRP